MDEDIKVAEIKKIKLEQTRLRHTQNPSVNDRKLAKRKQKLRTQYWKVVGDSR